MPFASPLAGSEEADAAPRAGRQRKTFYYTLNCPWQQLPSSPLLCGAPAGTSAAELGDTELSEGDTSPS